MPYFHFTLGPVQGFVAQARRTRDFWAGSFLLSWLAGVAMRATEAQGGTIVFPKPPQAGESAKPGQTAPSYLDWIADPPSGPNPVNPAWRNPKPTEPKLGPVQGAIPNRFKASVPEDFSGRLVEQAVREAWVALAEHIWTHDIAKEDRQLSREEKKAAHQVWKRQHEAFWEIAWVLEPPLKQAENSDKGKPGNPVDCRKNWRSHLPPPEPGMKCHLMEGWQELSGIVGITGTENEQRRAFWKRLTQGRVTDFREAERLCAIAYVKRRFVHCFEGFGAAIDLGKDIPDLQLRGWKLPANQPSTVYMGAVHWLEQLLGQSSRTHRDDLLKLLHAGRGLYDEEDEWESRIQCLLKVAKEYDGPDMPQLIALDGSLFFEHLRQGLLKEFKVSLKDLPEEKQRKRLERKENAVKDFGEKLAALTKKLGKSVPKEPTPFYAVLMMDGDNLGAHMGKADNQKTIPQALDRFTTEAARIVRDNNGSLIYAGGDDVLALLPLEDALACAVGLRAAYLCAFAVHKPEGRAHPIPTTLSGAVIFAHVKTPLGEVLRQAHRMLDKVAKDETGRDALAARVLKPGGEHLTWAQPWDKALENGRLRLDGSGPEAGQGSQAGSLVQVFRDAAEGAAGFSGKFFYKARERLRLLDGQGIPKERRLEFSRDQRAGLLRADFLASDPPLSAFPEEKRGKDQRDERRQWLDDRMQALLEHCTVYVREFDPDNETTKISERDEFSTDALMLIRFLAHKGVEPRG